MKDCLNFLILTTLFFLSFCCLLIFLPFSFHYFCQARQYVRHFSQASLPEVKKKFFFLSARFFPFFLLLLFFKWC